MKFAFLAATALALSVPAFAQDTTTPPSAEPDTMQTQDGTMTQDPATQATPPTNTPPSDPTAATPPAADPAMAPAAPAGGTMTDGGYAPAAPPMSGAAQPGAQVVFKPSVPVAQAFPPPPPKEEYPVCRGAVKDGCKNPGGV